MQILHSNIIYFVHIERIPKKLFCVYDFDNVLHYNIAYDIAYDIAYRINTYYILKILLLCAKSLKIKYLENVKCLYIQTFNSFFNT